MKNTSVQLVQNRRRLTRLGEAVKERLHESGRPVITLYRVFHEMRALYASGRKLMLRKSRPDHEDLNRLRGNLLKANILANDKDFKDRVYQIVANGDRPAEEICCLVDEFCYVSHLSAMARYGLTDRRPHALHLTAPNHRILPSLVTEVMERDYGQAESRQLQNHEIVRPRLNKRYPEKVRGQPLSIYRTSYLGRSIPIRGTFARIASVGQVFAETLEEPEACGGMSHVLDMWREHAAIYLDDILTTITDRPKKIVRVRAGYILSELLGIKDDRIETWSRYAQRGGSRVLDPSRPFAPTYSEKWMISLNVD